MALINCHDCGKEVSDNARICVHCGNPKNESAFIQNLGIDGLIFKMIISVGLLMTIGNLIYNKPAFDGLTLMAFGILFLLIRSLR